MYVLEKSRLKNKHIQVYVQAYVCVCLRQQTSNVDLVYKKRIQTVKMFVIKSALIGALRGGKYFHPNEIIPTVHR